MPERPYVERPVAGPPPKAPAGWYPDPDDPSRMRWWDGQKWMAVPKKGLVGRIILYTFLGLVLLFGLMIAIGAIGVAISGPRGDAPVESGPATMLEFCVDKVAEWAEVSVDEITSVDVSDENFLSDAEDYRGTYPGGEWACGGEGGELTPASIVVYADDGIGDEIFSDR